MWIAHNQGWLSIVSHRDKPDHLLVRARKREHLESLFPDETIYVNKDADYRYRADILRIEVASLLANELIDIQYDNFKGSVTDSAYHNALMGVWSTMYFYGRDNDEHED